jgi:hypothetical protein
MANIIGIILVIALILVYRMWRRNSGYVPGKAENPHHQPATHGVYRDGVESGAGSRAGTTCSPSAIQKRTLHVRELPGLIVVAPL